jgi:signal transduction histidine kinase/CheY-like chemotaxis protein/HPt (histidine-containing phosphotransfer) domain-containing protein
MYDFIRKKTTSITARFMTSFIIISVIVIMLVTTVIAFLSYKSIGSLSTINLLSIQKNKEVKQLDNIIGRVRELHSNVRDYVITRDSTYIKNIPADTAMIASMLGSFPDSLNMKANINREITELGSLITRKIAFNLNVLKLYRFGGRDIALEFIETGRASVLDDSIELLNLRIKEVENKELETSVTKYNLAASQTKETIIAASVFLIVLSFLFMVTTINNLRQRAKIISELETAKSDSEKASLLKDQFVSNISHEIRTPLNSIIGFTHLLHDTRLDREQGDFVDTIRTASENLLRIVNDILDFSKIEAGMMQIHRLPFSLKNQLENIEKLFDQSNANPAVSIEYALDPTLPDICIGDSVRLNQIMINLISNAIKFTEKGKILITAHVKSSLPQEAIIEFSIRDTGIGIPPDKLDKIFDRFEQINTGPARKPDGTISVASTEGVGTEFTFTVHYGLPEPSQSPTRITDQDPMAGQQDYLPLDGKILLVEDNPLNQKLVSLLLKKWQISFAVASNGVEACSMLRYDTYSLILMDIQMPEMDGYTATNTIRKKMGITTPIVALTAHSSENERVDLIELGMNGYITKPFREFELYAALARFLNLKSPLAIREKPITHDPLVNLAEIEKNYGGDRKYVKEMGEIFISQTRLELTELEAAYTRSDMKKMASTAHSMKSTTSYMGLYKDLEAPLKRIELCGDNSITPANLKNDIDLIKEICTNAITQLEAELPQYVS